MFNKNNYNYRQIGGFSTPYDISEKPLDVRETLQEVPYEDANLEAEEGETAVTNLNQDGVPEQYRIGGRRHSEGGTFLNLPDNSYIFSRDKSMKIKDENILMQFGITNAPRGGVTPADIAKRYNVNKFKKILLDKNSDPYQRRTAELMIQNYVQKLGKLALLQESIKGFPKGIPQIALPYVESIGLDISQLMKEKMQEQDQELPEARYGLDTYQNTGETPANYVTPRPNYVQRPVNQRPAASATTPRMQYNPQQKRPVTPQQAPGYTPLSVTPPYAGDQSKNSDRYDYRLKDDLNEKFNLLQDALKDEDLRRDLANKARELIRNSPDIKKKLSKAEIDQILAMEPDQLINTFLQYQKQNYALSQWNHDTQGALFKDLNTWDTTRYGTNKRAQEALKALGFDETGANLINTAIAQSVAQGMTYMKDDPNHTEKLKDFGVFAGGPEDYPNAKYKRLSGIEGLYGNNTARWLMMHNPEEEKQTTVESKPEDIKAEHIAKNFTGGKAPWWLQDVIKTSGAFDDFTRIKRYMPWQEVPDVRYMDPVFASPERELAANAEQLNIGASTVSQFTSPQSFNSRFSQMAGQAAKNAADILGRYNNMNIGIANEAEKYNTETYNQYAEKRAADRTGLYDKTTVANQQYDNAKAQSRQEMRQSFIDAITNRANAQAVNTLYPNFAVDPASGGFVHYTGDPNQIQPQGLDEDQYFKHYQKASDMFRYLPAEERSDAIKDYIDRMFGDYSRTRTKTKGAGMEREYFEQSQYPRYGQ